MALALVATPGASDANSYATAAEGDTYFEAHPDYTTWDALFTADKERFLILATTLIDQEPIAGDKYDTSTTSGADDQALRFPTANDYIDGAVRILEPVKRACYEQSIEFAKGGDDSTRQALRAQGVTSVKIGDVMETYGGDTVTTHLCSRARKILVNAGLLRLAAAWG
ncbi:MAG: hypothetical protein GY906_18120 [bacterium]|nr:hypothetical protein [bacterium]